MSHHTKQQLETAAAMTARILDRLRQGDATVAELAADIADGSSSAMSSIAGLLRVLSSRKQAHMRPRDRNRPTVWTLEPRPAKRIDRYPGSPSPEDCERAIARLAAKAKVTTQLRQGTTI